MKIKPYPAWILMVSMVAVSAWRLYERPGAEYAFTGHRVALWASLARMTPEELDRGLPHRYEGLASALDGAREVGYLSERKRAELLGPSATMKDDGIDRLSRYCMAQGLLPPTVFRVDEIRPLVVVDCGTPEAAEQVLSREGLTVVRDFGRGLILARPGS
jgi:hypothetical protein